MPRRRSSSSRRRPARSWPLLPSPDHPLWPMVRLLVNTAALTGFLYVNASQFDQTEGQSIVGMVAVNMLLEALGLKRKA